MDKYWKREGKWDIHRKTGRRRHPLAKKDKYFGQLDRECSKMNEWELTTLLRVKKQSRDCRSNEEWMYHKCILKVIYAWLKLRRQENIDKWGKGDVPLKVGEDVVICENHKVFTYDFTENEDGVIVRDIEGVIVDMYGDESEDEEREPKKKSKREIYGDWDYDE